MRWLGLSGKVIGVLGVLVVTQIIGWGTVGFPAVVGRDIAADLGMDLATVFAGTSVLYVVMGLWAPFLAKPFADLGARRVMVAAAALAVPGFLLLAAADGPVLYFAGWIVLGTAGAGTLTTAAYILLNEVAGAESRNAIGALMVITGLSSSIFWPVTSVLAGALGWRGVCLVHAGLMVAVCLPLYLFALPRRPVSRGEAVVEMSAAPIARRSTFGLIVGAIAVNAFVTFGLSAVFIELLKAEGLSPAAAVAFASGLGVLQVAARGLELAAGGRWDAVMTGVVAGCAVLAALALLLVGDGAAGMVAAFVVVYGLGSGALAVVRATLPLVFYDKAAFARATSRIALPLNLAAASSPPLLAGMLTRLGTGAVIGLAMACVAVALVMLMLLRRRRPDVVTAL